ncbi:MAG: ribosome-associated translation inhibitor RaiA [Victivallaceae bacterium]|nr:ribosome-associated translation inhibitor RaiA [Victivallaceae bacterium]
MQILQTGRNFTLTDAITQAAASKIEAIFENKTLKVSSVRIIYTLEKNLFTAVLTAMVKDHQMSSTATDQDIYKAIDLMAKKLETQVTRTFDKLREHDSTPLREAIVEE